MRGVETVRTARDLDELRVLFREYHAWVAEPACFVAFERELAELPGEYGPPGGALLVAHLDGSAAGCAALRRLPDGAGEMKRLYVRPAYRGRGLARRLALEVIARARAQGCPALYLDTLPKMAAAIALYGALGFARRGPYADAPTPGALFFELPL